MQERIENTTAVPAPYAILAEITHRCPLRCPYCSNPLQLKMKSEELSTEDWLRVLGEASEIGALQVHFSGGEPLLRNDLGVLIEQCTKLGLYSNLITSGVGLTASRVAQLQQSGICSVQISIQGDNADVNDLIAGREVFSDKLAAVKHVIEAGLPLTLNVVVTRLNIDRLASIIEIGIECGARKIELANVQLYGWAFKNKLSLLPSLEQLQAAEAVFQAYKKKTEGQAELIWVKSDYYEEYPKPCMGGWGRRQMTVAPDGYVYPCPAAQAIETLRFSNLREHSLKFIWEESESFNAFRGFDWMKEPCRSCEFRFRDFGGCRCQAFMLTGDAATTDPVCSLASSRNIIDTVLSELSQTDKQKNDFVYRE
jgi:pyrroloquinoline quinone biosynthesis protein E